MAKFRSYNEQLLIAQILLGNIFNDIVIDRRRHGYNKNYAQPIDVEKLIQKTIQIPCIFGDISTILRSLQNQPGSIRLPLFILQANDLKSDMQRNCDIHMDVFYQQDEAFFKLDPSNKLYQKYETRLNKQRGLPITIDYTLTLLTKYKEDLDQMITNWMVHCRPDLYVKWWHPRNKTAPLESEILWSQSVSYESPVDVQPTVRFQYKASTNFTFKTWVFPGTTQVLNPDTNKFIEYFNYYPLVDSNNGYESIGDILQNDKNNETPTIEKFTTRQTAGFFVADRTQKWQNDGSDPEGILNGQYIVNNVQSKVSGILYDPISGRLLSSQTMIQDLTAIGDLVGIKKYYQKYPRYTTYATLLETDPIQNEQFGFKYVYFGGGYAYEDWIKEPPSGDFLLKHFHSTRNVMRNNVTEQRYQTLSTEFGFTYTDNITPHYQYNPETKDLCIWGSSNNQPHYISTIKSTINSTSGITHEINLKAIPVKQHNIEIGFIRSINNKYENILENKKDIFDHVQIWNTNKDKWFESDTHNYGLKIETDNQKKYLIGLYDNLTINWDTFELKCTDNKTGIYDLITDNADFYKTVKHITNTKSKYLFSRFKTRYIKQINNIKYTLLINNYYYLVLKSQYENDQIIDEDIYDYGVVCMPKFAYLSSPIFNVTYPDGNLVYGINVVTNI